jgi:hypothetical protein
MALSIALDMALVRLNSGNSGSYASVNPPDIRMFNCADSFVISASLLVWPVSALLGPAPVFPLKLSTLGPAAGRCCGFLSLPMSAREFFRPLRASVA